MSTAKFPVKEIDTIIIGGGPAGLFTGIHLKDRQVLLLEKNNRPGKKLLISGSGQCNFTHTGDIREFLLHYGDHHRFIKTALLRFTNDDLIEFFTSRDLEISTDKNGKVFPCTNDARDVLSILLNECGKKKLMVETGASVLTTEKLENAFLVKTSTAEYRSNNLVIATGGCSYPATGSTGDGYLFARQLGHSVIPPRPALAPVRISDFAMAEIAGVSLDNKLIAIYRNNKKIKEQGGDVLFTHQGLSGPGILNLSRYIIDGDILKINLIGQVAENFRGTIIEANQREGKTALQTFLKQYGLPKSLVKIILSGLNLDQGITLARLDKNNRNRLVDACCGYTFRVEKTGGFNSAMVTTGGVSTAEINPKTMESNLVKRLYFVGEVVDIDGDTGGYNIQAAFSTAHLAASSINNQDRSFIPQHPH